MAAVNVATHAKLQLLAGKQSSSRSDRYSGQGHAVLSSLSSRENGISVSAIARRGNTLEEIATVSRQPLVAGSGLAARPGRRLAGMKAGARKRMFDDPFDYGEDPNMGYGDLYADGKQDATPPLPPKDESSSSGFLNFPEGYNPEIASLGLYIRGDVRGCAILVAGGVYENLLFFPVIQLLKEKYPGVEIDVVATDRGKQVYEMNKNVRRAWVYDVEDVLVVPADFTDMLGKLKNNCYDLVLSTRLAGMGHAMFLFLTDARQRISYIQPNANGAGAGTFLSKTIRPSTTNLAELGYNMYQDLTDLLCESTKFTKVGEVPLTVPPLKVGISRRVREVARGVVAASTGLKPGEYVLVHGVESNSAASMRSSGDEDSQLSVGAIAELSKATSDSILVVIPNENDRAKVAAAVGPNVKIVKITTPGQLAAVIDDSIGVVASNTAAIQLAMALGKPSVGLFGSAEKAALFAPAAKEKSCAVVASKTGKLADIDVKAASVALTTFAKEAEFTFA